ncbi:MAG: hypothetical protein AAF376_16050 [Pseudomonadota bacterium]
MRWDLLISDVFARFLGLIGLVAAIPFVLNAMADSETSANADYSFAAVLALVSLLFLLPKAHDVTLRLTRSWLFRPGFLSLCILWAFMVLAGLFEVKDASATLTYGPQLNAALSVVTIMFVVIFALLILPVGYAWGAYRDIHLAHEQEKVRRAHEAMLALQQEGSGARHNGMVLRKADIWDHLMAVPLVVAVIAAFYGFRISTTVQTAALDKWADENLIWGAIGIAVVLFAPMFVMNLVRGMPYNPRTMQNKWGRRVLLTVILVPLCPFIFAAVAYDGVPAVWNLTQGGTPETVRYEITDVSTGRRTRGCVTLRLVDQPDRQMYVCNLPDTLRVGDVIDATGLLSTYGHTIEQVRVVR